MAPPQRTTRSGLTSTRRSGAYIRYKPTMSVTNQNESLIPNPKKSPNKAWIPSRRILRPVRGHRRPGLADPGSFLGPAFHLRKERRRVAGRLSRVWRVAVAGKPPWVPGPVAAVVHSAGADAGEAGVGARRPVRARAGPVGAAAGRRARMGPGRVERPRELPLHGIPGMGLCRQCRGDRHSIQGSRGRRPRAACVVDRDGSLAGGSRRLRGLAVAYDLPALLR